MYHLTGRARDEFLKEVGRHMLQHWPLEHREFFIGQHRVRLDITAGTPSIVLVYNVTTDQNPSEPLARWATDGKVYWPVQSL